MATKEKKESVSMVVMGPRRGLAGDKQLYVGKMSDTVGDMLKWSKTHVYGLAEVAYSETYSKPLVISMTISELANQNVSIILVGAAPAMKRLYCGQCGYEHAAKAKFCCMCGQARN